MVKCIVASKVALQMVPLSPAGGVATHLPQDGNICDNSWFNVLYIETFALVLIALDNVAVRHRVNRICLAAGVPLVEARTAGHTGPVTLIDGGGECYEC